MIRQQRSLPAMGDVSLALGLLLLSGGVCGSSAQLPTGGSVGSGAFSLPAVGEGSLAWRNVGPYRGGRSVAVAGDPSRDLVFYFGSVGGGVWKTEDGGHRWRNVSDGYFRTGSVGAIGLAPSDPDIVYVGTGEACIRGNASHGDGVYRSTDGGATWTRSGLETTRHIARVRVHPEDPDIVYAAALGHAWGANPDRGVYRSKDGGATWEKVLYVDDHTGAIDLVMDPADPRVLYAAMWQAQRFPWGLRAAGPGSGLYKSVDGGDTWKELTHNPGLPVSANLGRIGVAVSPSDPNRVWAILEAEEEQSGVYRSDDGGASWQVVSQMANLLQRPWYYHHIVADPRDRGTVYVLNTQVWKSTDGGETYTQIPTPHGDNHDLWIDPDNPARMVEANDGGGTVSFDGGRSWSTIYNQPTAQFYHVTTDNQFPYRIYGAQQDNSTLSGPSRSDYGDIYAAEWYSVGGSEDAYLAVRPDDPNIVFAGDHYWLTRYDHRLRQVKYISPRPEMYWGWGAKDLKYRFQWVYPVLISPHDPDVLYVTSQFVHRSRDEGHSWEIISPDLTRADPKTLESTPAWGESYDTGPYWGPIKRDNTGIEWYATIHAFAESPITAGLFWSASDDGLVHVSRDGARTWDKVTPRDFPDFTLVSIVEASSHDPAVAYLAAHRYKLDDPQPYLYRTRDYGQTWTRITDGIRPGDFTRAIREDPVRPGLLYAATETGVYVSFDDGDHWQPLQLNLPHVPVHDVVVKGNDLVAATHGRSFWILDGLGLVRQLGPEALQGSFHLFEPQETGRFREGASRGAERPVQSPPEALGENPPNGVMIDYHLARTPSGEVTLVIEEASGATIHRFSSRDSGPNRVSVSPGLNRFVWDLRYPGPEPLEGALFRRYDPTGPLAPPGSYRVTLITPEGRQTRDFTIVKDPRADMTVAQFAEQHELLLSVRDRISETHRTVKRIRDMRAQLEGALERAPEGKVGEEVARLGDSVGDELYRIEEQLTQIRAKATQDLINYPTRLNDKFSTLAGLVEMADDPPTVQDGEFYVELVERLRHQMDLLDELVRGDWARLQQLIPKAE